MRKITKLPWHTDVYPNLSKNISVPQTSAYGIKYVLNNCQNGPASCAFYTRSLAHIHMCHIIESYRMKI